MMQNFATNLSLSWHPCAVIPSLCFLQQAVAILVDHLSDHCDDDYNIISIFFKTNFNV